MYRHFCSKEELLFEAVAHNLCAFFEHLASSLSDENTTEHKLDFVVDRLSAAVRTNAALAQATTRASLIGVVDAVQVERVRSHLLRLVRMCFLDVQMEPETTFAATDLLTDIWLPNVIALAFGRLSAAEVRLRLNRSAHLLLGRPEAGAMPSL